MCVQHGNDVNAEEGIDMPFALVLHAAFMAVLYRSRLVESIDLPLFEMVREGEAFVHGEHDVLHELRRSHLQEGAGNRSVVKGWIPEENNVTTSVAVLHEEASQVLDRVYLAVIIDVGCEA
jgi:hypothetical protein